MLLLLTFIACDDATFPNGKGDTTITGDGFCAVQSVLAIDCLSCHSSGAALGGLDLETDAWTALVGVESANTPGALLVVAGDPEGSLLYRKLVGSQAGDEGGLMPPTGALDVAAIGAVETWILGGATPDCGTTVTGTTPATYHPDGWADHGEHGIAAKYQEDACLTCHGDDLTGGSVGVSCDTCHVGGDTWREDCTFCHGGGDGDTSGAPPRDIDNQSVDLSFDPHMSHVLDGAVHAAYRCTQCHVEPSQALSAGHFLLADATPGVAEVEFSAGLASAASWSGTGCSNNYCHGTGSGDDGSVSVTDDVDCGDCHAVRSSGEDGWRTMSGRHDDHLGENLTCSECHADTVDSAEAILSPTLHVNGSVDLALPYGMTRDAQGCSGTCHGEGHNDRDWD